MSTNLTQPLSATSLGLEALAAMVTGAHEGIFVVAPDQTFRYANPSACLMLDRAQDDLIGHDVLDCFSPRGREMMLTHLPDGLRADHIPTDPFTTSILRPDGSERELVTTTVGVNIDGVPHVMAVFRDLTGPRAAARAGVALAQTAAQLVGRAPTPEILREIGRFAVEETRALGCGIAVTGADGKLQAAGGFGLPPAYRDAVITAGISLEDLPGGKRLAANGLVVMADARSRWRADPLASQLEATLGDLDWQAGVFLPLPWQDQVIGVFGVYLPAGVPGPTERELAFYSALADQAAVAVVNARLRSDVQASAVLQERQRLARDLHDSVSQALFSMTLHARAAELSLRGTEFESAGPLRETISQLRELTQGALAEMRALIFELRPGALAEEGLLSALRKQAAALTARESLPITVTGPEDQLQLVEDVEEHLYRIVLEALHNVVKHARASRVDVTLDLSDDQLVITVRDDGIGFDTSLEHPGHLGLGTMADRAAAIGAEMTIASRIGSGTTVTLHLPTEQPAQQESREG